MPGRRRKPRNPELLLAAARLLAQTDPSMRNRRNLARAESSYAARMNRFAR